MRILQVRFRNLNSLVGEWTVDLTHPAFTSDGLFAITGPTGAGKTTILDAMCLALYGRTPRLNKVNKSGNEIMSRQTGDCFAEVTFETQAGRYRCHWSQHRARKKPDGEFQAPKHEIANADSGKIFETKIRGVADQIEAATGMDFDRFTRSILLAQGGFDTFLKAEADKRAPILEQITGTEIYSRISIRIHERRSEERKRLDTLQAELAGMPLLTPEDEQLLAASLEHKLRQDAELTQQIAHKNQAITWIEGIARLAKELKQLDQMKDELQTKVNAFAPLEERLRLADQALELAADYAALTATRKEQDTDQRSLRECQKSLPSRTDAAKQAQGMMKVAVEQLEARKAEQQKALPVIRKVRELDLKIAEKDTPIQAAKDSITQLTTSFEALKTKHNIDSNELDSKRQALEKLQQWLETSKTDEALVEHLAGLRGRFKALNVLNSQLEAKREEITQADNQLQEASQIWQEQTTYLENQKRDRDKTQVEWTEKQAELLKILEGRDTAEWRQSQSLRATQRDLIGKALEAVQTLSKSKQATLELVNRQATLNAEESALTSTLASRAEIQAALEKERELLETQLTLLKKIEDLEEARSQLQDGEPCPLCGAKDHPFARGNIPVPHETRQRLTTVRADLKSITGEISDLKVKRAKVNKDLEQVASGQKEYAEKMAEASRLIGQVCSELPPDLELMASDPVLEEKLKGLKGQNARLLAQTTRTLEAAESSEKALTTLRQALEKAKDSVTKAAHKAQAAEHKKELAGQLLEHLAKEADGYRQQQQASLVQLLKEIQVFGVETPAIDTLDAALEQLTSRRAQWIARQKEKTELDQKIAALEMQTRTQAGQLDKAQIELQKQQDQLAVLVCEREAFTRERKDVLGDKNADDEEARLDRAIESAEQELDGARQQWTAANQELGQLQAKIDELEKAVKGRDLQLQSADQAFLTRLKASGFTDEEHYQSACLPESERKHLAQQSQKLIVERTEITSKEREKTNLLETERQKKITQEPLHALNDALAIWVANQKDLQQEIGGIRQRLKDNESLKQQQRARVQAIDAQKRECTRWDLLHELIGSADGKKYRNFAQGLTFEMMTGHANRQLQKMTDRYLLVRDDAQPLELNVIDNYQAGEVRSTKNLSGGESFIVSLSLALGLSHMASKNVRVDSLFLDEGFGTLDEEALDTALETLASLQQDGKLIGVISHVPALKERINTQIQVNPQTGGRSIIEGPGCSRVATPAPEAR